MFARSFLWVSAVFFLVGCSHFSGRHSSQERPFVSQSHDQTRSVSNFSRINVKGDFNVNLHIGNTTPRVVLHGDPRDLAKVKTTVVNGNLRVVMDRRKGRPEFGAVRADIYGRYLNAFEYHGTGIVIGAGLRTRLLEVIIDNPGKTFLQGQLPIRRLALCGGGYFEILGINSPYLLLKISGPSKVKLGGVINLASLDMDGDAWLSMSWVRSWALTIKGSGNAFIQMAGVVDRLYVDLFDSAHFNGRYLRARRSFVKTYGNSVAEISTVKRQHTLASDTSDIRYYNLPDTRTDFMANEGAVLDMRDLGTPFLQEYNPFNK